jgi:hypothetical protein
LSENKDQFDSAVFHYNMAIVHFQQNDYVQSRYHLELAKLTGGETMDVNKKLEIIKDNLGLKYLEEPETVSDYIYQSYYSTPTSLWLIALFVFVGAGVWSIRKAQYWLTGIISATLITIAILYKIYISSTDVVIWVNESTLYQGPSEVFETTQVVSSGSKLVVEYHQDGWLRVKAPSNISGWLKINKHLSIKE